MSKFYVCSYYPECCSQGLFGKNNIDYAFAASPSGGEKCYPKGICGRLPECCDDNSNFMNVSLSAFYNSALAKCQDTSVAYKQIDTKPEYGYVTVTVQRDPLLIWQYQTIPLKIAQYTSPFSAVFCVLVILTYIGILIYQPILAKRCSLRLSVAVSFMDLIYAILQSIDTNSFGDIPACTFSAITQVWAELLALFFTAMIALNLLLVFVLNISDIQKIEIFYYIAPLIVASLLVGVPGGLGYMGYFDNQCFFRYDKNADADTYNKYYTLLTWTCYFAPMIISIAFSAFVVIAFWLTLLERNAKKSRGHGTTSSTSGTKTNTSSSGKGGDTSTGKEASSKIEKNSEKLIQKAVIRIAWYPIVPLLTAFPLALVLVASDQINSWQFNWAVAVISNGQGIGNAMIFFFDPSVALARETLRKYLTDSRVLEFHPMTKDGTRSIEPTPMNSQEKFSYTICRFLFARQRDFDGGKKKVKGGTSATTSKTRTVSQHTRIMKSAKGGAESDYSAPNTSQTTATYDGSVSAENDESKRQTRGQKALAEEAPLMNNKEEEEPTPEQVLNHIKNF